MPKNSIWSQIRPNMTFRLFMIIIFLVLIALGNIAAIYESIGQNNLMGALLYLCVFLVYAVPAYGIFQLKRWARITEIILSLIMILLGIVILLFSSLGMGLLVIIVHSCIVACLLSNESRRAFGL